MHTLSDRSFPYRSILISKKNILYFLYTLQIEGHKSTLEDIFDLYTNSDFYGKIDGKKHSWNQNY